MVSDHLVGMLERFTPRKELGSTLKFCDQVGKGRCSQWEISGPPFPGSLPSLGMEFTLGQLV